MVRYLERRRTRFEHAEEIRASEGLRDFAVVAAEFEEWLAAGAYVTGDGPRVMFADATGWLRGQKVLLPGVTTLARLVARARSDGDRRLWDALAAVPTGPGLVALDALLDVEEGARASALERARRGPADPTGTNLKLSLRRVRDVHGVGVDGERARALVPARRLAELARYGLAANAPRLRRHPTARRIATLVATLAHLQATSIDDCLELFDLLIVTELLGKAERETNKQRRASTRDSLAPRRSSRAWSASCWRRRARRRSCASPICGGRLRRSRAARSCAWRSGRLSSWYRTRTRTTKARCARGYRSGSGWCRGSRAS